MGYKQINGLGLKSASLALGVVGVVLVGCGEQGEPRSVSEPVVASMPPELFIDSVRFEYDAEIDYGKLWEEEGISLREPSPPTNVRPDNVSFGMTFVPGDPARGVKPFYLSTTEVTAEMFYPWATGIGLGEREWARWASLDLRPSRMLFDELLYGSPDRPALGMSRVVAEHYCDWLSRQTGRTYRLPTETEWVHALEIGGGVPDRAEVLLTQATLQENQVIMQDVPFLERPTSVGQHQANKLGLYDMLGSAAEWVADTGDERVVRGGHYMLNVNEVTEAWRAVESVDDWNSFSPWGPQPAYWYTSFPYTGIRLACDVDQAPASEDDE